MLASQNISRGWKSCKYHSRFTPGSSIVKTDENDPVTEGLLLRPVWTQDEQEIQVRENSPQLRKDKDLPQIKESRWYPLENPEVVCELGALIQGCLEPKKKKQLNRSRITSLHWSWLPTFLLERNQKEKVTDPGGARGRYSRVQFIRVY